MGARMRMAQTEILRQKIEVDLAARGKFQIERILIAFVLRDQVSHLADILRDFGGGGIVNIFRSAASSSAAGDTSPPMTRARVSAICSQVSASVVW